MKRLPMFVVCFSLFWAACGGGGDGADGASGGEAGGAAAVSEEVIAMGTQVYTSYCIACHQAEGQGVPNVYPPLTQTEWTTGDKGRLIRLVLNGMQGEVEVLGQTYNQIMTAHNHLSDDQIAAVLTYVRTNFGNSASAVTPAEVASVRAATTKEGPWEAAELEDMTGLP